MYEEMIFKRKKSLFSKKISVQDLVKYFNLFTICQTGERITLQNQDAKFVITKKNIEVLVYNKHNKIAIDKIQNYFLNKGEKNEIKTYKI